MWSCSIIWYSLTLDPWIFPVWTSFLFLLLFLLSSFLIAVLVYLTMARTGRMEFMVGNESLLSGSSGVEWFMSLCCLEIASRLGPST